MRTPLPTGFARINAIVVSRKARRSGTHYVVECETVDGLTKTEVSRDRMDALGMFDALRDQELVPLTRCCCQAAQKAAPKGDPTTAEYAKGRSKPSVRTDLPPPGYIRVISVERLTNPQGVNDLVVVFYESAKGAGSIVLTAQHAAALDLGRAEHEEMLISLPEL